jgi:hypothetical protein
MEGFIEPLSSTRTRYESPIERAPHVSLIRFAAAKTVRRFRPKPSPRLMCEPLYGRKMWSYSSGHEREE